MEIEGVLYIVVLFCLAGFSLKHMLWDVGD
jgi:hypothetical protein